MDTFIPSFLYLYGLREWPPAHTAPRVLALLLLVCAVLSPESSTALSLSLSLSLARARARALSRSMDFTSTEWVGASLSFWIVPEMRSLQRDADSSTLLAKRAGAWHEKWRHSLQSPLLLP